MGLASLLTAQNTSTSLRGTICDVSGAVIQGAQVTLVNGENGFIQTRTGGADGAYQFQQLPPGNYTVSVEAAGFGRQSVPMVLVINQPATLNFSLAVESAATTINVSGQAPALNTTDATIGSAFDSATIEALPVEGEIPDLLSLQPGVLYLGLHNDQTHDSRSGSSAGARSDQNNSTLDGLDNNDQAHGYAYTGVLRSTLDSVEEFRVTTSG